MMAQVVHQLLKLLIDLEMSVEQEMMMVAKGPTHRGPLVSVGLAKELIEWLPRPTHRGPLLADWRQFQRKKTCVTFGYAVVFIVIPSHRKFRLLD